MINKYLSLMCMVFLLFAATQTLPVQAQTQVATDYSKADKIKANVLKRGTGKKQRVKVRLLNGTKFKGFISQTGNDSFELTNSKTKQTTSIAYRDVESVKRNGLSTAANIGILAGVGAGLTVAAILIAIIATGGSDIFSN